MCFLKMRCSSREQALLIADLPTLQKNLAAIEENLTSQRIVEVLRQWYINHESVRDAILVEEREISKVAKTKPQSQEKTLENRYRVLQEEVQKLQERKNRVSRS
jgi:hypothetical protein